jgi:hypothetical protein
MDEWSHVGREDTAALVIGACDGRRLAYMMKAAGTSTDTVSPESVYELYPGNEHVSRLYEDLSQFGYGGYLKIERESIRARIQGRELVVLFPFYEYTPLYFDLDSRCYFNLRCRPGSQAHTAVFEKVGSRLRRHDPDRNTYYDRLSEAIRRLAQEFSHTQFLILLPGYDPAVFGPDHRYNCPFVSNTFENFDAMTLYGRSFMPAKLRASANVAFVEIEPVLKEMLDDPGIRVRHVFPFFVPRTDARPGFHRDIAHISDMALSRLAARILREAMPNAVIDDPLDQRRALSVVHDSGSIEEVIASLRAGTLDSWANGVELALDASLGADVEEVATEALADLFARGMDRPDRVLLLFAWTAYARNIRPRYARVALEAIIDYLIRKDLEYGAWKDFLAAAITEMRNHLDRAEPRSELSRWASNRF